MSRPPISPLLLLGIVTAASSAWCYKVVPEPGYVPHVEEQPCDIGTTGNCFLDYLVCQQGDKCATALTGYETCTDFMANRPMMIYNGGFVNGFGCCEGSPAYYVGLDPLKTRPTPLALTGMTGCAIFQPGPH